MKIVRKLIERYERHKDEILLWINRHLSERDFLLILGGLVGFASALVAVLMKNLIHYFSDFVITFFAANKENYLFLFLPVIGLLLSYFYVHYVAKDDISHGVSKVLQTIAKGKGYLKPSKMYSSVIASTVTIGFGGSVGPEAPVVLTGAAIGSNIGRFFRVNYKTLVMLIACGTTGAVAGIFGAPLAGLVFALEVLMIDLTMSSLIPILIAAVVGAVISAFLTGRSALFHFDVQADFKMENLPYYVILGLVAGFLSHYFLVVTEKMEDFFSNISNRWNRIWIGGGILSILIFIFPPLYGEGFTFLADVFQGNSDSLLNNTILYEYRNIPWVFLGFVLVVTLLKVVAMALTNGGGGVGGVFAPSMFMGAMLGLFISKSLNVLFDLQISEANFALVGMAAVMSGVMHAPLTAVFLVAEITGGFKFFIPLMLVSTLAFLVNLYFNPHSIYTKKLAEKGELFTHNKDAIALSLLQMDNLIEKDFSVVSPDASLGELVKTISTSTRNLFPVVDADGKYLGIVFLDDVKSLIFRPELYDKIYVRELYFTPRGYVGLHDNMDEVAQKFLAINQFNFPVLDGDHYVGFLSRAQIFSQYREMVKDMSED